MAARRSSWRRAGLLALFVVLVAAIGLSAYWVSRYVGLAELQATGRHRLAAYSNSLEREIAKYAYFPATLALERDVLDLLAAPGDRRRVQAANRYLEALNERAGTLEIYILSPQGTVLSASNWQRADSFIGENLAFRAYYREALEKGAGRLYGVGTTRGVAGYYLSSAIVRERGTVGVAVVKVGLDQLEKSWAAAEAPLLVSDENGVAILSSVADWKYSTLLPLAEAERLALDRSLQYNGRPLRPLGMGILGSLDESAHLVRLDTPAGGPFLAQSQTLPAMPWTLTVFSDLEPVEEMAASHALIAGIGTACVFLCLLLINLRRRHRRDRLAARDALEKAEAEKLAAIGRMCTGVAHELNQPLAALCTLSGNTARFLERGDVATARTNLQRIGELAERMGSITRQLKSFAHPPADDAAAPLGAISHE